MDFEEASPGVRALLITRILHPELAEVIDRPEEFFGPGLPPDQPDAPNAAAHVRVHALVLENSMENEDAASALNNLVLAASRYHKEFPDALHVGLHIMMMIQAQQIWGGAVSGQGETDARKKQGEAAIKEANAWFTNASKGHVKKLPRSFRAILRHAPVHPAW